MNTTITPRQYVALPSCKDVSHADFWLCLWIRRDMQAQALDAHIDQAWKGADELVKHALIEGLRQLRYQVDDAITTLTESGGLLYAFEGTTRAARATGGAL